MNINEFMIKHKFAKNEFNANAIFWGLELQHVPRFWERVKRIIIYRRFRTATKDTSKKCFEYVLSGKEAPPELPLGESGGGSL